MRELAALSVTFHTQLVKAAVKDAAKAIKDAKVTGTITVTGHTDSTASDSYNLDLSRRRAEPLGQGAQGFQRGPVFGREDVGQNGGAARDLGEEVDGGEGVGLAGSRPSGPTARADSSSGPTTSSTRPACGPTACRDCA